MLLLRKLSLGLLRTLLAERFGLLLLLGTWGRRSVAAAGFDVHRWDEWTSELLLCDERMELGLLWRPSF